MESIARPFSHTARSENVERLASEPFDLLVIGGGITGAAIARDATLRGIKTALVEKGDFAAGTSSRSARLIHGGLRI
jgi:glycerol-3-phosphate dehydrogenase